MEPSLQKRGCDSEAGWDTDRHRFVAHYPPPSCELRGWLFSGDPRACACGGHRGQLLPGDSLGGLAGVRVHSSVLRVCVCAWCRVHIVQCLGHVDLQPTVRIPWELGAPVTGQILPSWNSRGG